MCKKILLAEDDDFFRAVVRDILKKKYEVIEASNGRIAQEFVLMSTPDLILSDIQMPHLNGIELLAWTRQNSGIPVIIMTGFSDILETHHAVDLGAADFLAKPFKEVELFEKIEKILSSKSIDPSSLKQMQSSSPRATTSSVNGSEIKCDIDHEFCKLPIEDFVAEKQTECGIYLKINNHKFIKIAHQGGKLPPEKISFFKEKGITHLYVRLEDFTKLVGFTVSISKAVAASGHVDKSKKIRFIKYTGEMLVQNAFLNGADENLVKNAKDFLSSSISVLTEHNETFTLLSMLSSHTDYLYAHSLGVSTLSVLIAQQLGWQSKQTLFKVAFAGLFHDIGKKEIPREILEKPRSTLEQQERSLIESHTTRGKEILESIKIAPSDVVQVAYEHHENTLGQGYPRGITQSRIHPLSLIISVADIYCDHTIKNPMMLVPLEPKQTLEIMKQSKSASLDKSAFMALCYLFGRFETSKKV